MTTTTTTAAVLEFMHRTAADDTLRQQLEALLGVGDSNISREAELDPDETAALTGDRAPEVAAFAAQNGFQFSTDELIAVVSASIQVKVWLAKAWIPCSLTPDP